MMWTTSILLFLLVGLHEGSSAGTDIPGDFCQDKPIGSYRRHPRDCSRYVRCLSQTSYFVMSCTDNLIFDEKVQACNFPSLVDCSPAKSGAQTLNSATARATPSVPKPVTRAQTVAQMKTMNRFLKSAKPEKAFIVERMPDSVNTLQPRKTEAARKVQTVTGVTAMAKSKMLRMVSNFMEKGKRKATQNVRKNLEKESRMAGKMPVGQPSFKGVSSFLGSTKAVKRMSLAASQQLETLKIVKNKFKLTKEEVKDVMATIDSTLTRNPVSVKPDMDVDHIKMDFETCPFPADFDGSNNNCDHSSPYRTTDGTCNNLQHALWGRAMTPFIRLVDSDYCDNIDCPRRSKNNDTLPSARLVSRRLFDARPDTSHVHTLMLMTVGQFTDHDLTKTAVTKVSTDAEGGGELSDVTCGTDGCSTKEAENRACMPIFIPAGDADFGSQKCIMFVRTQEVPALDCQLGPRQQVNQLSHYLDASNVYGSSKKEEKELRGKDSKRGRLRHTTNTNSAYKPLLPTGGNEECSDFNTTIRCFKAGDERVNENVALTGIHSIMMRVHNDIEGKLHTINPQWDGERLYQETRKIVGAIWQHIVYNEYLPIVLGPQNMARYRLTPQASGFSTGYDINTRPDMANVFATAAFRFSHSMIADQVTFSNQDYSKTENVQLSSVLRRPFEVYNNGRPGGSGVDSLIYGLVSQKAMMPDRHFTKEVTAHLFSTNPPNGIGMDLVALNIQRGRDHGLPGYNAYRKWCGLSEAKTFDDMTDISDPDAKKIIRELYRDVNDVDVFVGGMNERLVAGGLTGPTFACIIARQFRNTKVGDRFWYENRNSITGFTLAQLTEIRKITLAKLICNSCDQMDKIQKYVMLQPISVAFKSLGGRKFAEAYSLASLYYGEQNERRQCSQLPDIDLQKWKQN